MDWLKDPAWQQGVAILVVVAGSILIYRGAAGAADAGELSGMALFGVVLFSVGIALPLISQVLGARPESTVKSEDVS